MKAQLTKKFKNRVETFGVPQRATARLIGVSPQQFSEIWNGNAQPSTTFIIKAIQAGLGENFSDIAEARAEENQQQK